MTRQFTAKPAVREAVPLLVGLMGPSGGGKTFSALRLATGIQSVTGGDIYGIDTEARRMLHYADRFKFKHVQFDAPFGSLDYLDALEHVQSSGGKIAIVDSMSHEHEGPGGLIDLHDQELQRLTKGDMNKVDAYKLLAWQKPKSSRRKLINRLLQMNIGVIFCFRAKDSIKPMKLNGKTEIVRMGFMPIAGDEFLFEQTVNCLLLPNSGGVPTWQTENVGERQMMKLPQQFKSIFADQKPLDENIGRALAEWARGGSPVVPTQESSAASQGNSGPPGEAAGEPGIDCASYMDKWESIINQATSADQLRIAWNDDAKLRKTITWDDGAFSALQTRVGKAIEFLEQ